jgi:hypothetical protein
MHVASICSAIAERKYLYELDSTKHGAYRTVLLYGPLANRIEIGKKLNNPAAGTLSVCVVNLTALFQLPIATDKVKYCVSGHIQNIHCGPNGHIGVT